MARYREPSHEEKQAGGVEFWAICPVQSDGIFSKNVLEIRGPYPSAHAAGIRGSGGEWGWAIIGPVASLAEAMEQRPELFVTGNPYTHRFPEGERMLTYRELGGRNDGSRRVDYHGANAAWPAGDTCQGVEIEPVALTHDRRGFTWGPMEVLRSMVHKGGRVVLTVRTRYQAIDIVATPGGRVLRIYDRRKSSGGGGGLSDRDSSGSPPRRGRRPGRTADGPDPAAGDRGHRQGHRG